MEVRAKDGKGSLLFEWDPETQTVDLIRKDILLWLSICCCGLRKNRLF